MCFLPYSFVPNNVLYLDSGQVVIMGRVFSCSLFLYRDIYYLVMAQFRSTFIDN